MHFVKYFENLRAKMSKTSAGPPKRWRCLPERKEQEWVEAKGVGGNGNFVSLRLSHNKNTEFTAPPPQKFATYLTTEF